jgi:tetratricopeptide (TPR) repeat protein
MKLKCKFKRSLAYFELQKYDEVVRDCTAVLHLDANSVPTRALLGRALKILNEHKKAEEQLSFAILLDDSQAALFTGF